MQDAREGFRLITTQIHFWQGSVGINNAAWIVPLLMSLVVIQFFGVKGYGEVEFVISMIKIAACTGFIILGIIINCGGVPTDDRGYIGVEYWYPSNTQRHVD
jgi:amino acid transporter